MLHWLRCTSSLILVMTHKCLFIGLKAPVLHDPCATMFSWPKIHHCSSNGSLVLLIDIFALDMLLLFAMGASATGPLFGEDASMLFLRFGCVDAPWPTCTREILAKKHRLSTFVMAHQCSSMLKEHWGSYLVWEHQCSMTHVNQCSFVQKNISSLLLV